MLTNDQAAMRFPHFYARGERAEARPLDKGMGTAIARRTVFRPEDKEDMGRVADRVAEGNLSMAGVETDSSEFQALRNAIASGALITSGRHLQHGDAKQKTKAMELHTNCSSAALSFQLFTLLLSGSGVGRSYDDSMMVVDWRHAPRLEILLTPKHQDYPKTREQLFQFGREFNLLPYTVDGGFDEDGNEVKRPFTLGDFDRAWEASITGFRDELLETSLPKGIETSEPYRLWRRDEEGAWKAPAKAAEKGVFIVSGKTVYYRVPDTREGWGMALELYESLAFARKRKWTLALDFSDVRPLGAPIGGMQDRPASGPLSVLRAFHHIDTKVVQEARASGMELWEQAMRVDHYVSEEVQVGGARRAARMSAKSWYDPGVIDFIAIKAKGGLWTSNNSIMVDKQFWNCVRLARLQVEEKGSADGLTGIVKHAWNVYQAATAHAYINGEPGFINGDKLASVVSGKARQRPVVTDGSDFGSRRYKATWSVPMLAAVAERAAKTRFPMVVNPCGEVELHVLGAYCVIADYAPLLACPFDFLARVAGDMTDEEAKTWDERVEESVRLAVRFCMRVNLMDSLYHREVARTNRIGVGPTGIHEFAWARFGLDWNDLLDPKASAPFWQLMHRLSQAAKDEARIYAKELGVEVPHTSTTVKPAGSTSKLYGLSEGAHLPARRQYLRWVQFRGQKSSEGKWRSDADPLLAVYEEMGYPVRELRTFPGMSIVGFPTVPLIVKLGLGDRIVTAPEATPEDQFRYLQLLERFWIGAEEGNQVSYTMKIYTDRHDLASFRRLVAEYQPTIRACSILPSKPDHEMGYEYLPEQEMSLDDFGALVETIKDPEMAQEIDMHALQCASGVCPI